MAQTKGKRQKDIAPFTGNPRQMAFHRCGLYTSDNVGTQILGLGHITSGADNHWYNGYREQDFEGRCGAGRYCHDSNCRYWGEAGENHGKLGQHDSAGISLASARWLVEQKGALLVGSDTSGLEVGKDPDFPNIPNAVHECLLVQQGAHRRAASIGGSGAG